MEQGCLPLRHYRRQGGSYGLRGGAERPGKELPAGWLPQPVAAQRDHSALGDALAMLRLIAEKGARKVAGGIRKPDQGQPLTSPRRNYRQKKGQYPLLVLVGALPAFVCLDL